MKRVLTAVVLIPLVLWLVLKAPVWLLGIVTGLVALVATREYLQIVTAQGFITMNVLTYISTASLFGLAILGSRESPFAHPSALSSFLPVTVSALGIGLILAMRQRDLRGATASAILSVGALLYIALPLLILVDYAMPSDLVTNAPRYEIAALMVLVWAGDIFAFYTGRTFGKRLLAPRISPKKTWEGAVGSFLGTLLLVVVSFSILYRMNPHLVQSWELSYWVVATIVINVSAQFGDLVESMMKRGAGIKDSGSVLPGHGGMLDRIDALLFASAGWWCFSTLVPLYDLMR